jgi:hypothetical protein
MDPGLKEYLDRQERAAIERSDAMIATQQALQQQLNAQSAHHRDLADWRADLENRLSKLHEVVLDLQRAYTSTTDTIGGSAAAHLAAKPPSTSVFRVSLSGVTASAPQPNSAAMEANGGGGGLEPGGRRRPSAGERRRPPAGYALYLAFLYLPAQEIARCRMVSKPWRDITGTETFRREHHRHHCRMPMPLLVFRSPGLARCSIHAADTRDRVTRPLIPLNRGPMLIHSSFAGILLLSFGKRLYACNPCTRRWARLPPLHLHHRIIGFYGTAVGFHVLYHDHQEPDCMYWIFKLDAKPVARLIGRPGKGDLDLVRPVLANGIAPSYAIPPVCYHVYLCWPPRAARGTSSILMFDTVAESFSLIPPPNVQVGGEDIPIGVKSQLFEMHQHLAMAHFSPTRVYVWVRSNITGLWSHLYRIPLPVDVLPTTIVFAVARERNHLLQSPHVVLSEPDHGIFLSGYTIQESLLLHPSILPLQDTDAVDGDPPFFRN